MRVIHNGGWGRDQPIAPEDRGVNERIHRLQGASIDVVR
jgi:hypothetical protein